jgi:hypothetical protein
MGRTLALLLQASALLATTLAMDFIRVASCITVSLVMVIISSLVTTQEILPDQC